MNNKIAEIFETLIPFMVMGVAIALFFGLLFMFSYVLVWGFIIGGVLWLVTVAKQFLFPKTTAKKDEGRIIEHDDRK